jgi:hypothetical protein
MQKLPPNFKLDLPGLKRTFSFSHFRRMLVKIFAKINKN